MRGGKKAVRVNGKKGGGENKRVMIGKEKDKRICFKKLVKIDKYISWDWIYTCVSVCVFVYLYVYLH